MTTWNSKGKATEFLRPEEFTALLSLTTSQADELMLRTLWETGGRPGEVVRLIPEHIDPRANCILLYNFKQNKRRRATDIRRPHPLKRIYLFPESTLCQDLLLYCSENHIGTSEWVFPSRRNASKPFSHVTLWRMITSMSEELGIRYIKKDTRTGEYRNKPAWPGLYRHGMAQYSLHRTGRLDVVQSQLGHSSISSTQVYAGLSDDDRKNIIGQS